MSLVTSLALLRGVNVGAKNRITSADLVKIAEKSGGRNPTTYLQSGNLFFESDAELVLETQDRLIANLSSHFEKPMSIVFRNRTELERVVQENPYPVDQNLAIMFLQTTPAQEFSAKLDPNRSFPDRFTIIGNHIYLHVPTGLANTKLTNAYFDSKLKTLSTVRNWQVTNQLLHLLRARENSAK